jgi:hypothetical protein
MSIPEVFSNLIRIIDPHHCCSVKHLNPNKNNISVARICKPEVIAELYEKIQKKSSDTIYIESTNKFTIIMIPATTNKRINLFHNSSMYDVYSKFATNGVAIEGCFDVKPVNLMSVDNSKGCLIIDNHQILKIVNHYGLRGYISSGINVKYIEGFRLFIDGKPYIPFEEMKDVWNENMSTLPIGFISGGDVQINYQTLIFTVKNINIPFEDFGPDIKFIHEEIFVMHPGLLIVALDRDENMMIIYRPNIDYFNMILLLDTFHVKNAIVICDSDKAHLIWKASGKNTYNQTDFVGDSQEKLSNIITISGL